MEDEEEELVSIVYPDIAFDFSIGSIKPDIGKRLPRQEFESWFFKRDDNVTRAMRGESIDRVCGTAIVYDFEANGIVFQDELELGSISVYTNQRTPFNNEVLLKDKLEAAAAQALHAVQVLNMSNQEVSAAIGSDAATTAKELYVDAFQAAGGESILDSANRCFDGYVSDVVDSDRRLIRISQYVPISFLERLREMYDHPTGNQLFKVMHIIDHIAKERPQSNKSQIYTATLDRMPFDSTTDSIRVPMIWYLFSVEKTVDHPKFGVRGILNLYGWTKSLIGLSQYEIRNERMPSLGTVALSLLTEIASALLGMPISLIYMTSLRPTDRVIEHMRNTCKVEIPLVAGKSMERLELESGEHTSQLEDVVFVYPEFRACWEMFTTTHHPSKSKQKRRRRCIACKISGVQLYTALGNEQAGTFCSKECYLH
jgi:hypothetical protein